MTSPRRKSIKWNKWQRKNPDKADAAQLRKISRLIGFGRCFTRKARRQYDRAFKEAAAQPNPFTFVIKPTIEAVGFRMKLWNDDDGYQICGPEKE